MIETYIPSNMNLIVFKVIEKIKNIFLRVTHIRGNEENDSDINDRVQINQQAERVLQDYGNSILRIAYSYLHDMSDAEDVLQDTVIQYLKNTSNFENSTHEKAWLMRVAINISKNKIVYNKKRQTVEIDEGLFIEEERDLKFVWDAVKSLPDKYREVIHLFYQEGYSTLEIAKVLSKNEATVRSLLHRARGKLKEILKEAYDFDE